MSDTSLVFEPSHTTHWKTLFPSKNLLLGSHNLNEGEELVATMKAVATQEIKDQQGNAEAVPIVQFDNAPPMVLNMTNSKIIAALYGDDYQAWVGRSVQIYATKVRAFGKDTTALRIREAIPDTNEDITDHENALKACTTMDDLKTVFMGLPKHLKTRLIPTKDAVKVRLEKKK
jgi:hypothetical protein